jgi:hypothetical protein
MTHLKFYVTDLIFQGSSEAVIELTLSLHVSPELSNKYGSQLKVTRTIRKSFGRDEISKLVSIAGQVRREKSVTGLLSGDTYLKEILGKLGLSKRFFNLLLLDDINLRIRNIMDDNNPIDLW